MAVKTLTGTSVLMVIAPEDFRDEELLEPKKILSEAGAKVTVASTKAGEAKGMLGARVTADTTIDKIKTADFHGVIVVGGMGSPTHLWHNAELHNILRDKHNAGNVIGGICLSGAVLANAGVLQGKRATVWATDESLKALETGKATYTKEHVVRDGNIVTADGPEAAAEFGRTLVNVLQTTASRI